MEDDDDSLLAILAFLDAEEVGLPLLDDEEAVPRQPSSQDFPSKRRKRRSVKEIIDELRDQAQDLEAQLYLLRCQENHIIHGQSRGYVEDSSNAVAMWKNVASRQYQQRQESQSLNAHLHQLVTSKAKIIEDMQRLLRRGITWPKTPSSLLWMPFHSFQEFRPSWLHQSWRLLHNAAVEMYDHLELVMTEVEMWDQHELRVVAVGGVDRKGTPVFLNVVRGYKVPFDCHATANAVWQVYGGRSSPMGTFGVSVLESSTTVTLNIPQQPQRCHSVLAGRRYTTERREIIVLAGDVYLYGEDRPVGHHEHWFEITSSGQATIIRTKEVSKSLLDESSDGVDSKMVRFGVQSSDAIVELVKRRIENTILSSLH